jgi:prepilin-type N-terminal cleavage/methylation domain-containing protein
MLAAIRRRLGTQDGFTLIELLVGMTVGMIVLFALYSLLDSVAPATTRIQDRIDAQARGRAATEQMAQLLRTTVCVQNGIDTFDNATFWSPYAYGDDNKITFYTLTIDSTHVADVASGNFEPQKRTLAYANGAITETMQQGTYPPNSSSPTWGGVTSRTVVTDVEPIPGKPIFTFKGYSGQPATLNPITPANDGTGTVRVLDPDLPRISSIDVAFRAVPNNGRNPKAAASFEDTINTRPLVDLSTDTSANKGPQCQI